MWDGLMRYLPAGSTPWLMIHELRVNARRAKFTHKAAPLILIGLFVALTLGAGVPLARSLAGPVPFTPQVAAAIFAGCLMLLAISISQALTVTIQLFFERGDFDLLFSSPIPPARVLYVRLMAIAFSPFLYFSAFLTCILLPTMVLDDPRLFGAYGLLAVVSILSALIAVALGMALYRALGPRRTRRIGHLLAIVFVAVFVALAQVPQYFEYHPLDAGTQSGLSPLMERWFALPSPLSWPGAAAFAAPGPLLGLMLFAALAFWLAASRLGRRFAAIAASAQGKDAPRSCRADTRPLTGFSGSRLWALVRKEWRQLLRDPMLLGQVLLQGLFVVPLLAGFYIGATAETADVPAPHTEEIVGMAMNASFSAGILLVVCMMAGSLVEIVVMGEDAPDLVASAPVSRERVRFAKLFAALFPIGCLTVLLTAWLTSADPWTGIATLALSLFAAYSVCYITFWYEKPQPLKNFRRRQVEGTLVTRLGKLTLGFTFAPVAVLLSLKSGWALAAALLPMAFLGILYACRRYDA